MSLACFHLEEQVLAHERGAVFALRLGEDDLRRLRALDVAPGGRIAVLDAERDYFVCELRSLGEEGPVVSIAQRTAAPAAAPKVLLAQGLAKGDRMDEVASRAAELGVGVFAPFACARSAAGRAGEEAHGAVQRWRALAQRTARQAGRPDAPQVYELCGVDALCGRLSQAQAVLVCWEEAAQTAALAEALAGARADAGPVAVVVGPEGGLEPREVDALLACNPRARLVSLGPSVLRTETAGVLAAALVLYELGCLGPRGRGGSTSALSSPGRLPAGASTSW